jgi:hypothetical protein
MMEISPIGGRNIRLSRTANGTLFVGESAVKSDPGTPGVVKQFRIKTISDDYLGCVEYDGSEGEAKNIAKPWRLRKTPFHNQAFSIIPAGGTTALSGTYVYDATDTQNREARVTGGFTELQTIARKYVVNDVIYASESENGTLVSGVDWIELNVDGRSWAALS